MADKRDELIEQIIAETPGAKCYDDLSHIQQNNIEAVLDGPFIEAPFAPLDRDR